MDDSDSGNGPSLSRRGLIRGATGVVMAGALMEAAAGSLGASAAPASGQAGKLTLFDANNKPIETIDVLSWSWGATNRVADSGGSPGGVMGNPPVLAITKEIDQSSAILLQQEAGQPRAARAVLSFTSADGQACSIELQQIQSVSNELDMAVKRQGAPGTTSHHAAVLRSIIIVLKFGKTTITITIN